MKHDIMRNAEKRTYAGDKTYCPTRAYGDCPYCDQHNVCHIDDPIEDCDDFAWVYPTWNEWFINGEGDIEESEEENNND